ncbi:MAG: flagellar brake domain-containing protein [Candidatus Obscuribacterales bacterium]|nr:flagellar brake domain-containing protein [Steroidobacteraceae bacterium]
MNAIANDVAGDALASLRKDYGVAQSGHRFAITMAPAEKHEAYTAWMVGKHEQCMIVTAPIKADGSLVAIAAGQTWICRTFQMTSAFRFRVRVLKTAFDPFPHLHLELPKQVERRKIRGRPRANIFVHGQVEGPAHAPCMIMDLSVSGVRIAVAKDINLEKGQTLQLKTTLDLVDFKFDLSLKCSVAGVFGPSDSRHPGVAFYGLQFGALSELESLVLHGFVNGHLAVELNSLWQILSSATAVNEEPGQKAERF